MVQAGADAVLTVMAKPNAKLGLVFPRRPPRRRRHRQDSRLNTK
jgi:hypothetical protein